MWQGCGLIQSCPECLFHWELQVWGGEGHEVVSELWWGLWGWAFHRMFPPHNCVLKCWGPKWGGHRVGLCALQGCIMGTQCLRMYEEWGGSMCQYLILHPFTAIIILYTYSNSTFWEASGSFSDQWKPELGSKGSVGLLPFYFWLSPLPIWAFILATTSLLGLRSKEVGSLMVSVSICPLTFSVMIFLCCFLAKDFLFPLYVWAVP